MLIGFCPTTAQQPKVTGGIGLLGYTVNSSGGGGGTGNYGHFQPTGAGSPILGNYGKFNSNALESK